MAKCAADSSPDFGRPNLRKGSDDDDQPKMSERRIVLLGKAGVGKSASANTILGEERFESQGGVPSTTCGCSKTAMYASVLGRSVSVVDTPALVYSQMDQDELIMEISSFSSPGPHAFLIVLRVDDRDAEEHQLIIEMFGQKVWKYSIILFTHGDLLEGKTLKELIEENL